MQIICTILSSLDATCYCDAKKLQCSYIETGSFQLTYVSTYVSDFLFVVGCLVLVIVMDYITINQVVIL